MNSLEVQKSGDYAYINVSASDECEFYTKLTFVGVMVFLHAHQQQRVQKMMRCLILKGLDYDV